MNFFQRGPLERRGAAALILMLFVAAGVVLIFTGALTRSADTEAAAQRAREELAVLEERVATGEAEISFLATPAFVQQLARGIGWGEKGEIPFELGPGAPSPRPIAALGSESLDGGGLAPFDAWMELLFGT